MRALSSKNLIEVQKVYPEPIYVVLISTFPLIAIASRGPVDWEGITFQQSYLDVVRVDWGNFGDDAAIVRISKAFSDDAVTGRFINVDISVGALYGDPPYAQADLIDLFTGSINSIKVTREWVELAAVKINSQAQDWPNFYYEHQNQQPAGITITLRTVKYVLERVDF